MWLDSAAHSKQIDISITYLLTNIYLAFLVSQKHKSGRGDLKLVDPQLLCNDVCLMSMGMKIFLGAQYPKLNYKARELLGAMNEPDIQARKPKSPSGYRACF